MKKGIRCESTEHENAPELRGEPHGGKLTSEVIARGSEQSVATDSISADLKICGIIEAWCATMGGRA